MIHFLKTGAPFEVGSSQTILTRTQYHPNFFLFSLLIYLYIFFHLYFTILPLNLT